MAPRFKSMYVNACPVWECSGCGTRRSPSTPTEDLAAHEAECGAKKTITLRLPYRCLGAGCPDKSHRQETQS